MKLLTDEMYSPEIAEQLRVLGHDVVSAQERADLRSVEDDDVFRRAQLESRVILTNNHRDYAPLVKHALEAGEPFCGIIFTADRSMPRNRATIPTFVARLRALLDQHRDVEQLSSGVIWLSAYFPEQHSDEARSRGED